MLVASSASAVTVDGMIGVGEYATALTTTVLQMAGVNTMTQGPGNPGSSVENVGYTVYYTSDSANVYVGLQSNVPSGLLFANIYFDTNNATAPGSDIGFEVTNNDAFVPATGVKSASSLTQLGGAFKAIAGTGNMGDVIEVSIPWTVFTTNASGLGQPLVAAGGALELRTIQAFNYAGATGDGVDAGVIPRFGFQNAPSATAAVPEPASWAMMLSGFAMVGYAMRRRRVNVSFV